jgi:hypothetical protein
MTRQDLTDAAMAELAHMTEDEARAHRADHDNYAKAISRMTKAELAILYRREMAIRGTELLYGGPGSKDEFISAIMNLNYPAALMNETSHVLYHKPGENWSACEHCQRAEV